MDNNRILIARVTQLRLHLLSNHKGGVRKRIFVYFRALAVAPNTASLIKLF